MPPLVPPAKKARFRILLYTGPYYKAFYVLPATSIGRSARLFLGIQKENFEKNHFPHVKQGRENQPPFEFRFCILLYTFVYWALLQSILCSRDQYREERPLIPGNPKRKLKKKIHFPYVKEGKENQPPFENLRGWYERRHWGAGVGAEAVREAQ